MNQNEAKLWMNRFEVEEKRIEFVINNSLAQSNNLKIQHITLKVEEIRRDCRLHLLGIKLYCSKFLFSIIRGIFRADSNI